MEAASLTTAGQDMDLTPEVESPSRSGADAATEQEQEDPVMALKTRQQEVRLEVTSPGVTGFVDM